MLQINKLNPCVSMFFPRLQQSSEERLGGWCDAARFIVTGCKRPKLAAMFSRHTVEEDGGDAAPQSSHDMSGFDVFCRCCDRDDPI